MPNQPVVAVVGDVVTVLTVDSDAVVNVVGVTVLSAKHTNTIIIIQSIRSMCLRFIRI